MSNAFIVLVLLATGLLNVLPAIGVLSGAKLHALYSIAIEDPNLLILMRHRAVLFGLLGGFVVASVWIPGWRAAAMLAVLVSMLAFIALAWAQGDFNAAIRKVALIDAVLCALLLPALALQTLRD